MILLYGEKHGMPGITTNKEFLQSMNGILHNNKRRTAGKAWSSGRGYSKNTRMRGNPWTTLCPAPMYKNLTEGLWFPNNSDAKAGNRLGAGAIIFDTYVRGDIDADQSLKKISGADIYNTSWGCWDWNSSFKVRGFFYLRFDYDNMKGTKGKIKVFGEKVRNWERKWGKDVEWMLIGKPRVQQVPIQRISRIGSLINKKGEEKNENIVFNH
jgi:hypothetical protein